MTAELISREQISAITTECLATELKTPLAGISGADVLKDLPGADSMKLLRVVSKLERQWDVEFEDEAIFAAKTVDDLVTLVQKCVSED